MNTPYFPEWRRKLAAWGRRSSVKQRVASPIEMKLQCAQFLPEDLLEPPPKGKGSRNRVFDLSLAFWCFIWQATHFRTSCRAVVRQIQAFRETEGSLIDEDTSAYCQARARLPVDRMQRALEESAHAADKLADNVPGWNRPIKVVDSTCVQLADTEKNRELYPYAPGQRPGCGFPVMGVLGLFSLASGTILKTIQAAWTVHDYKLFKQVWPDLKPGDIVLGDRAFGAYEAMAFLPQRGVDVVFRLHQSRRTPIQNAKKIGPNDWLVIWTRSPKPPPKSSVPKQEWNLLPSTITVRITCINLAQKGFRTKEIWISTTLLDPVAYPADKIAYLYWRRWNLELCFRDLKTTMGMEVLRCQTPDMVHKELLAFLVAHNFIRCLIAQSSRAYETPIARISFKGTVDAARSFFQAMRLSRSAKQARRLYRRLLEIISLDQVPLRPGRREPRAVKRRPKNYQRLRKPRHSFAECPHRNQYKAKRNA
jgi:hypothetical protein